MGGSTHLEAGIFLRNSRWFRANSPELNKIKIIPTYHNVFHIFLLTFLRGITLTSHDRYVFLNGNTLNYFLQNL